MKLDELRETKLAELAQALVDQRAARIVVPAQQPESGFWFGGGNMIEDASGMLYLVGRYRNVGDSRTGLGLGQRGLELAIFQSSDRGETFQKIVSFTKSDLNVGDRDVLSIEGSALRWTDDCVKLFVSTEKSNIADPPGFEDYLKPGTGVWTVERLAAASIEDLPGAKIETVLECRDPQFIHVKDPFVYDLPNGDLALLFCTHPYCWSSSNTGLALRHRDSGNYEAPQLDFFPRGVTWDVAITRGTAVWDVPHLGAFRDVNVSLVFYDGGESLRNLDEHATAVKRPRGYSCEELGGVGYLLDGQWRQIQRLSRYQPMFVSPWGTGCSRYVDIHTSTDAIYATWQQSQADLSQPLVLHRLALEKVAAILGDS